MGQELNRRDLVILYVIAKHNESEIRRLRANHIPPESWPSAAKAATITTLWGRGTEEGLINTFIAQYPIIEPIRSAEVVYRCLRDRLWPMGLVYPTSAVPDNQFAPTPTGLAIVKELSDNPFDWPDKLPVEAGKAMWSAAKYPYQPAF